MPGAIARKYSDDQRDAVCRASYERGIKPAHRIAALAAAGELELDGRRLEPFSIPAQTVRDMSARYRRRRQGLERSRTLELEPTDQLESLRRRLVAIVDAELADLERRGRGRNLERIRVLVRVLRELAALPHTSAPAPAAPPKRSGSETAGQGLAPAILRAARAPAPAAVTPTPQAEHTLEHTHAHEPTHGDAHERTGAGV